MHQFIRHLPERNTPDQMRRFIDAVLAGAFLAITAPLMLLVALAIRLESPGPILVSESCIGLGGRRFQMLKFRTVRHDPDQTEPIWARKLTPVGEILRFTRMEALPELINVLRGEMSIIDPDGRSPSLLD
ncbi:MAG: sugar transferase [Alphaproteobacteria bacterium]|nr:sugar transferase [Alphaproteobacteria bacterium]